MLITTVGHAQVGIGTLEPHASAMLDIQSNSQGLLAPRMTSVQRNAIVNPAESLLVYDTTERGFYYYDSVTSTWVKLANEAGTKRTNYKLIKNVSDLAPELVAGGGNSYKLNTNTYYEINGTIELAKPIDLNDAYIAGMDSGEDILRASGGTVFKGNTGGGIRNLTLRGKQAFDITSNITSSLLVQSVIIDGMTGKVGNISGFGLYFSNIVQFINNADGITYSNIGNLLLNNQGWLGNNRGTFEKFTGTFGLIEKVSGFSTVNGTAVGVDVSSNPTVGTGILQGTGFSGAPTGSGAYIKGYNPAPYSGYNFTTAWTVDSPGIPRESDSEATGDINLSSAVGSGATTYFSGTGASSQKKVEGPTTSLNLFRFEKDGNNKLRYLGKKPRYFQVSGSVSFQGTSDNLTVVLYIAKNGTVLTSTKVFGRAANGFFVTDGGILALPIIGVVELKTDDTIEIFAERYSGTGNMQTVSLNLIVR